MSDHLDFSSLSNSASIARGLPDDALLNRDEAIAFLRLHGLTIARGTLDNWRASGRGPSYLRVARKIVYQASDLRNFIRSGHVVTRNGAVA